MADSHRVTEAPPRPVITTIHDEAGIRPAGHATDPHAFDAPAPEPKGKVRAPATVDPAQPGKEG